MKKLTLTGLLFSLCLQLPLAQAQTPEASQSPTAEASSKAELDRLNREVLKLYQAGQYAAALVPAQRALAISEKANGPDHPLTGTSLNNLAALYRSMGRHADALPLYVRALAISEKAQGPEHPVTGTRLNAIEKMHGIVIGLFY